MSKLELSKLIKRMGDVGLSSDKIFYVVFGDYPTENDIKALYEYGLNIAAESHRYLILLRAFENEKN